MYSTKNIENILIAELSRSQEKRFMEDVSRDAEISYKKIWQVRKKEVYQRIFGNKYRIWIPLDIEVDTVEKNNLDEYNNIFRRYRSADLSSYIVDLYNFINIANDYGQIPFELTIINHSQCLLFWIKGYIKIGKNIVKISTLIKKLQSIIKKDLEKAQYDDIKNRYYIKLQQLETALADFNKRDRDERLPKELYLAGRNVPDEEIYGSTIKKDKLWICISRHPADIGAMSTRQGWASCQNLDKDKLNTVSYDNLNWHVKYDVALGTCVAYLITESNIKRSKERQNVPNEYDDKFKDKTFIPKTSLFPLLSPTARVLIKPYFSEDGQVYLTIGTTPVVYGDNTYFDVFTNTVNSYFEEKQSNISGTFRIPRELYNEAIDGGNMIEVKNGKIFDVLGRNDMYNRENEVPSKYTDIILNKLKNIASSMEKSEEGIEKEYIDDNNGNRLHCYIIANKSDYRDKDIKEGTVAIINSNLTNCNIKALFDIDLGYAINCVKPFYNEITSELPEQERARLHRINISLSDNYNIFQTWAEKEANITNCTFLSSAYIRIYGKLKFNNCTFETFEYIHVLIDTFSNLKNSTFNHAQISIQQINNLSKPKEVTGNTYNDCRIIADIRSSSPKKIIYFVGDTFNNTKLFLHNSNSTLYFVNCTFNGELLKGKYKVHVKTHDTFYYNYNLVMTVDLIRNGDN